MHRLSIARLCALDRVPAEPLYIKEYNYSLVGERSILIVRRVNNGNIELFGTKLICEIKDAYEEFLFACMSVTRSPFLQFTSRLMTSKDPDA